MSLFLLVSVVRNVFHMYAILWVTFQSLGNDKSLNVSVLHKNSEGIGKSILDARVISQRQSRGRWAEGMDFPIPPEFLWSIIKK